MQKYTKLEKNNNINNSQKQEDNIKYDGYLKVVQYEDYEIVLEPSSVIILPYLKDEGYILLRHEYVPTYQYFYKNDLEYSNIKNFLTVVSGTVEKNESLENTLRRELYEETGIVLSNLYQVEFDKHLFISKGNVSQYHTCILELKYNDYKLVQPKNDGSKSEQLSRTIKISLGDLNEIKTHDLITEYMLTKFKLEYKL